jgi:hypothetical protein
MRTYTQVLVGAAVLAVLVGCGPKAQKEVAAAPFSTCQSELVAASGANAILTGGGCVISPNGQYVLSFGSDGNIVLGTLANGAITSTLWQSDTGGGAANVRHMALQVDGNLVMLDGSTVLWQADNIKPVGAYKLFVTDDGHVDIAPVTPEGVAQEPVWVRPS